METFLIILSNPLLYFVVIVFIGRRYLERHIDASVNAKFAEKLETHKHELQLITQLSGLDFTDNKLVL